MPSLKPKARQPSSKAELRAQAEQALAQASKPVTKLPMKIKRHCARCDRFNSVLVEPGEAVPAFKCSACGYSTARPSTAS
jgi:transposase-like protein